MTNGVSIADAEKMCGLSMDEVMNISKNNQTPVEQEANKIWEHLEHLASTDKRAYDKFVKEQMEEGKEFFKKYPDGKVPPPQPKIPTSVFWVETEVLDSSGRGIGIPRYFNICESEAIEFTDDKNLNIFMSDLDNRQIDCVIHPSFMEKCKTDNLFMHDTLQMIFTTYTSDHKEKEKVRHQYQHHAEPRKLVMKVPKAPGTPAEPDTAMDILSKVRHSEKAKQLVDDERESVAKRLFTMYGEKEKRATQPAPDPETSLDFGKVKAPSAKKKVGIEELKPKLTHTMDSSGDDITVRVTLPEGTSASDVDLELVDDIKLAVNLESAESLEVLLPRTVQEYSAKYIKTKRLLKVTLK
eukprot:TRINITY_DN67151_c0_g1_i1.p1 TRINITY_DN67151_c0_g1~~TRINITY_DN67151_c0_g1_i1.p1  ORF type:complete len:354 (+),score=171.21 TRINITY_DN67151_c0_g1_i1:168-1229(+)